MKSVGADSLRDIFVVVSDAIATVSPNLGPVADETPLIGREAVLDSVGFVTLLVTIEQKLNGSVDLAASFMAQGDADSPANPFRTVGSLTNHLYTLLYPTR